MQAGQSSVLGLKERLQCISPIRRGAPCSVEVAPEAAGVPPKVPGDLGETGPKAPLFGLHALGQGLGLRCRIVAEEGHDGSELGRDGLGSVFLPIHHRIGGNAHPLSRLPLQEAKLPAALLEVLAQSLGFFGIILCSQGLEGQRRLTTKGHRSPGDSEPFCSRSLSDTESKTVLVTLRLNGRLAAF
jgi:hypothetical protein